MSDKQITNMLLVLVIIALIVPGGSISFSVLLWVMGLILANWLAYKFLTQEKVVNVLRVSWDVISTLIKVILVLLIVYTPLIGIVLCLSF